MVFFGGQMPLAFETAPGCYPKGGGSRSSTLPALHVHAIRVYAVHVASVDASRPLPGWPSAPTLSGRSRGNPLAREQRKLAAILFADVVGSSRLMGRDESGTVARLWNI